MFDHDGLVPLAEACPLLESFHLGYQGFIADSPVTVSFDKVPEAIIEFAQRAMNIYSLQIFIFNEVIDIDIFEAFDSVARSQYKSLAMPTRLKSSSIHRHRNDKSPFFPCLEWLEVNSIEMDIYIRPSRLIKYLVRAAPMLKGFSVQDDFRADLYRQSRRVQIKWNNSHNLDVEPRD